MTYPCTSEPRIICYIFRFSMADIGGDEVGGNYLDLENNITVYMQIKFLSLTKRYVFTCYVKANGCLFQ